MNDGVLNAGLELAMEFGENWLEPIQSRLAKQYPKLSRAELDTYDAACREAMKFGHRQVLSVVPKAGGDQQKAFELFRDAVRARYPWIVDERLSHLFSQGCYYAMK